MSSDVGDGWAARARAAETYAALLLRQRDELHAALTETRELVLRLPEDKAAGSHDFGRGYALACRDVVAVIDHALHPDSTEQDAPIERRRP